MTDQNELLWNHAIENENWVEAARLQQLAKGIGETSMASEETGSVPMPPSHARLGYRSPFEIDQVVHEADDAYLGE